MRTEKSPMRMACKARKSSLRSAPAAAPLPGVGLGRSAASATRSPARAPTAVSSRIPSSQRTPPRPPTALSRIELRGKTEAARPRQGLLPKVSWREQKARHRDWRNTPYSDLTQANAAAGQWFQWLYLDQEAPLRPRSCGHARRLAVPKGTRPGHANGHGQAEPRPGKFANPARALPCHCEARRVWPAAPLRDANFGPARRRGTHRALPRLASASSHRSPRCTMRERLPPPKRKARTMVRAPLSPPRGALFACGQAGTQQLVLALTAGCWPAITNAVVSPGRTRLRRAAVSAAGLSRSRDWTRAE